MFFFPFAVKLVVQQPVLYLFQCVCGLSLEYVLADDGKPNLDHAWLQQEPWHCLIDIFASFMCCLRKMHASVSAAYSNICRRFCSFHCWLRGGWCCILSLFLTANGRVSYGLPLYVILHLEVIVGGSRLIFLLLIKRNMWFLFLSGLTHLFNFHYEIVTVVSLR